MKRWPVVVAAVVVLVSAASHMSIGEARAAVFARDDGVNELYVLAGTALYGRLELVLVQPGSAPEWRPAAARRWMRVVDHRRLRARALPANAAPVSIGRDATGRTVVVFTRYTAAGKPARWWLYDVARDSVRRLHIRDRRSGCTIETVAVWRSRQATVERCRTTSESYVVLREHGRRTELTDDVGGGYAKLLLRRRSLAVVTEYSVSEQTVWRVLDRGKRCPKDLAGAVEERGVWAGLGTDILTWAIADYRFDGLTFSGLEVSDIGLSGRCERSPGIRTTPQSLLPQMPIHGSYASGGPAIDGRTLYYATDTEIQRVRLP